MSNKWIKKLDEQKLVGCEVYNGSTILWAKKIIYKDEVGIQILTIENLFENSNDIQKGDFIECYEIEEIAATL